MNKLILTILVVVGAVAAIGMSTLAVFTDLGTDANNVINAGTVDIKLNSQPVFLPIPSGYAPGDISTGEINVQNLGSLDMRYAVTRVSTSEVNIVPADIDLAPEIASLIQLRIGLQGNGVCDPVYHLPNGNTPPLVNDTHLFSGPLHTVGAEFTDVLDFGIQSGLGTGQLITIGDPFQGQQPDDRLLIAGASEILCWSVVLPRDVGDSEQGDATTALFSFYAEQTDNNP